jgi:NAD(P)-dependent dehydrogenase (short-subunit alcohol dehydrogenase family)
MSEFDGLVALVTGGGSGIGAATAALLHERGARVAVLDRSTDGTPAHALALPCDVTDPGGVDEAVTAAAGHFGALDIVINNAAILRDALIFKSSRADWQRVIDNNLTGAWAVLAAATPVLREAAKAGRSPGRIVNIVSSAGLYGNFGQSAYAASKAGLVGLTRVVAMDMARSNITCNAVAPFAATRVTASIQPANEAQADYKRRALSVPAAYVARLVGWLSTPACAVSGQLFGVRGREIFVFAQPRPAARVVTPVLDELTPERLDALITMELSGQFTDLRTDLEAFNSEPLL